MRFPNVSKAIADEYEKYEQTHGRALTNAQLHEESGVSLAAISHYRRGLRLPNAEIARRLALAFYPDAGTTTDRAEGLRKEFIKRLTHGGATKEQPMPPAMAAQGALNSKSLIVRSTNYMPFAGSGGSFLDSMFTRFLDLADLGHQLENGKLETKELGKGDLLLGLWDALDRVLTHGLQFAFRLPFRTTLGGICHARHDPKIVDGYCRGPFPP